MPQRVHPRRLGWGGGEEKKGETHSLFEGWITQERERDAQTEIVDAAVRRLWTLSGFDVL